MKLFRVVKTVDGKKIEMIADENQLQSLKSDDRFEIGEEIKPEKKKGKKEEPPVTPEPPVEMPE